MLTIFTYLFRQYLFNVYYGPGAVLGAGNTMVNKTKNRPCPYGAYNTMREEAINYSNHTSKSGINSLKC